MSLNIKNEDAHKLARQLSDLTGESLTDAVTNALRARLQQLRQDRGPGVAERLLAIGKDCAAHLREPLRSINHGDMLYDENGLPK